MCKNIFKTLDHDVLSWEYLSFLLERIELRIDQLDLKGNLGDQKVTFGVR